MACNRNLAVDSERLAMPTATPQTALEVGRERAGIQALSIFARGLNARILRAHRDRPLSFAELEERLGWAAEASLRMAATDLCELGVLEREGRQPIFTRLTDAGLDLLGVAEALERWLSRSSFGSLDLDDPAAQGIVRALVAGWEANIAQALARRPRRLADLSSEVPELSYAALKRRFVKMRGATLATCLDDRARSPEYEATPLLRYAARPIGVAARWERHHLPGGNPIDERDLEAVLRLALPLIELPVRISGRCILAAPALGGRDENGELPPAAISVTVEEGRLTSVDAMGESAPATWALGTAEAWLQALLEAEMEGLRIRGPDAELAAAVLSRLHHALCLASG